MEENIKAEIDTTKNLETWKKWKINIRVFIIILTVVAFIIIPTKISMLIEKLEQKETIANLKFERYSVNNKVKQLMLKLDQTNQRAVELDQTNQRAVELEANLRLEQNSVNNKVKQLMSQLDQANQRIAELKTSISRESINKFTRSKPALTNWVFENSSKISKKIAKEIVDCILETNFPLFLLALIKTESTFDPTSVSKKGALGLGQVMPKDYEERLKRAGIIVDIRDTFDIPAGVKSTEFAWNDKLVIAEGDIMKALELYLGKREKDYINQILRDFLYLNYLCKKPEASLGLSHTPLEMHDGRLRIPEKPDRRK